MSKRFSIYIHWPYCLSKCPYCDFNSHIHKGPINQKKYLELIKVEMAYYKDLMRGKEVQSIFFGGGTPSLMNPSIINQLLDTIHKNFSVEMNAEISLEANPTSIESKIFREYSRSGINRVSVGVQSLNDNDLKNLGRNHDAKEAIKAVNIANENFSSVSIDLIYCRPDQTAQEWELELQKAINLKSQHVSLYQLTIEPNTVYKKLHETGKLQLPNNKTAATLYNLTTQICKENNLIRYEISNYAKEGHESKHNLNYWTGGEWIGFGPGSHGRLEDKSQNRYAIVNEYDPKKWENLIVLKGSPIIKNERLTETEVRDEYLIMAMRTKYGLDLDYYKKFGGVINQDKAYTLETKQFIRKSSDGKTIVMTDSGFMICDFIVSELSQ